MDQPIIQSLLDTDFYKFTMGQLVFLSYPETPVVYGMTNRTTSVHLPEEIDIGQLREELDQVRQLRFNNSELHFLRGTNEYGDRMFDEEYLKFLRQLQLPEYELEQRGGQFHLQFPGRWSKSIYWETIALSIVNELYYRQQMAKRSRFERDVVLATGKTKLAAKIAELRKYPELTFSDFGTRRRFSRDWQSYVVRVLAEELPDQFLGSSNVRLAMDLGILPMGTSAHEMYMIMSGIMHGSDQEILASHNKVLRDWWNLYGWGLSIALTDTYGSDFFFRDMSKEQALQWKGLRHDSGDPIEFGEKSIRFYEAHGIDARSKLLIFSDGLDLSTMIKIFLHFQGRIKVSFGWGTNLSNDLDFNTLSLVVKAILANGHHSVKLSDNLAKASGPPEEIARFKRIFGHKVDTYVECQV